MPTPRPESEKKDQWLNRCIPVVISDKAAKNSQQAVAICSSMWTEALKKRRVNG